MCILTQISADLCVQAVLYGVLVQYCQSQDPALDAEQWRGKRATLLAAHPQLEGEGEGEKEGEEGEGEGEGDSSDLPLSLSSGVDLSLCPLSDCACMKT